LLTSSMERERRDPDPPPSIRWRDFSVMQIRSLAAQTTVAILAELGLPCAIFGSMACKLYGNQRIPNDIDILVLPPPERASITQEEIKALIAQHASPNYHFVLKPARNPLATYKVLYFIAKPRPPTISQEFTIPVSIPRRFSSKVDILLPGVMHLPALPTSMITQLSSLPLVPFPVLLLQKLQGWADHRAATEARYRNKIGEDSRDLMWCLNGRTVKRHLLKYVSNGNQKELWSDRTMFSEEFEALSRVRVREFCDIYTGIRGAWKAIGFDV